MSFFKRLFGIGNKSEPKVVKQEVEPEEYIDFDEENKLFSYKDGFYNFESSPNKSFKIGYDEDAGRIILFKNFKKLFEKKIIRPAEAYVNDNGFSICNDWMKFDPDTVHGKCFIYDKTGNSVFNSGVLKANLDSCYIDEKLGLFFTHNSNFEDHSSKIWIVDLETKRIISTLDKPQGFHSPKINYQDKTIEFSRYKGKKGLLNY